MTRVFEVILEDLKTIAESSSEKITSATVFLRFLEDLCSAPRPNLKVSICKMIGCYSLPYFVASVQFYFPLICYCLFMNLINKAFVVSLFQN